MLVWNALSMVWSELTFLIAILMKGEEATELKFLTRKSYFPFNSTKKDWKKVHERVLHQNATGQQVCDLAEEVILFGFFLYKQMSAFTIEPNLSALNKTHGNLMQAWPDSDFTTELRSWLALRAAIGWASLPSFRNHWFLYQSSC